MWVKSILLTKRLNQCTKFLKCEDYANYRWNAIPVVSALLSGAMLLELRLFLGVVILELFKDVSRTKINDKAITIIVNWRCWYCNWFMTLFSSPPKTVGTIRHIVVILSHTLYSAQLQSCHLKWIMFLTLVLIFISMHFLYWFYCSD